MKDERYKQLMIDIGMPNSISLLLALKKVANEVAQEKNKEKISDYKVEQILRAFWRRAHIYKDDYGAELPDKTPTILLSSMTTALSVLNNNRQDKPAIEE